MDAIWWLRLMITNPVQGVVASQIIYSDISVTKQTVYVVQGPPVDQLSVARQVAYIITTEV